MVRTRSAPSPASLSASRTSECDTAPPRPAPSKACVMNSIPASTTASGLLISWATPAASVPMETIRSANMSCSSSARRAETSRATPRSAVTTEPSTMGTTAFSIQRTSPLTRTRYAMVAGSAVSMARSQGDANLGLIDLLDHVEPEAGALQEGLGLLSQHASARGRDEHHDRPPIDDPRRPEHIGDRRDDLLELRPRLPEAALQRALLATVCGLLELALDRRHEPGERSLDEIVVHALAHRGDGRLFADGARDDDEGHVEHEGLHHGERRLRAEARHVEVGEDDLPGRPRQRRAQVALGVDALPLDGEASAPQLPNQEQRVVFAVFDEENP